MAKVSTRDCKVIINDAVAKADIAASNDVIHAIDEPHAQRSGSAP